MKKLYTLFITLGIVSVSNAQVWTFDDFDGNVGIPPIVFNIPVSPPGLWQVGTPSKPIFNSAFSVQRAIVTDTAAFIPAGTTASFEFKFRAWSQYSPIMAIHWMQKLDLGANDAAIIEFSNNSGQTWQNAFNNPLVYNFYGFQTMNIDTMQNGTFCLSGRDTTWRNIWLCFAIQPLLLWSPTDSLGVRFTLISDSSAVFREGWMIDDVNVGFTMQHTVKEDDLPELVNIYPNPASDRLNIKLDKVSQYRFIESMMVVDANGRVIKRWGQLPPKYWIDVSDYKAGLYKLVVHTNVGMQAHSFVVE